MVERIRGVLEFPAVDGISDSSTERAVHLLFLIQFANRWQFRLGALAISGHDAAQGCGRVMAGWS